MAIMTLPVQIPDSPSSPDSDNKLPSPNTPVSPTIPTTAITAAPSSPVAAKRKPSRRANTAERRATHNAVERQRRETLNGRFLDLAALLPNLSQIRRPSKSSIVNSSIAHIHASRRHRMLAARELRLLKLEADALRRELNEWRERAGIPRIEDPIRGDGFSMILSGELEVIVGVPGAGEGEDDDEDGAPNGGGAAQYGGYVGGDGVINEDEFDMDVVESTASQHASGLDDPRMLAMLKSHGHANPFAHSPIPPTSVPGYARGSIPGANPNTNGGPTNVPAFDALYEHYPSTGIPHGPSHPHNAHAAHAHHAMLQQQQHQAYLQAQHHNHMRERDLRERDREYLHHQQQRERELHIRERERSLVAQQHHAHVQAQAEKMWGVYPSSAGRPGSQGYNGQQQQQQMMLAAQRSLFTPPATSHGLPTPSPTSTTVPPVSAVLGGPGPAVAAAGSPGSSNHGSPPGDDIPSSRERARSGSVHSRSSGGSARGSHSPSYELGLGGDYIGTGAGMSEYGHGGMHGHGGGVPRMMGIGVGDMPLLGGGMVVGMN